MLAIYITVYCILFNDITHMYDTADVTCILLLMFKDKDIKVVIVKKTK